MNTDSEQQQPPPEILYKYRDWTGEFSKRSIENLEVFFPSPRRFNDPFDCAIPPDPFTETEDETRARAARSVAQDMPDASRIEQRFETESRVERFKNSSRSPEIRKNISMETTRAMADEFGVLSLTTDPTSILMWSYYADKHAGLCVGYDVRVLRETVNKVHETYALLKVKYQRDFPDLRPQDYSDTRDLVIDMLTIKAKDWEHEQEYRLILDGRNDKPISLPKSAIAEVIVGARMPQKHIDEVANILEGHDLSSTLRQAKLKEDEYAITIEQIPSE